MFADRVLSGMRPTGRMHIGHYHGALKNWVRLQEEYECLYFAADWHALTTHFDSTESIADSVWEMFVDWFAAGIANVFVFNAIRLVGPTRVTSTQFLVPAGAVVLGAIFLNEPIRPVQVVGGGIIIAGVALTRLASRVPRAVRR